MEFLEIIVDVADFTMLAGLLTLHGDHVLCLVCLAPLISILRISFKMSLDIFTTLFHLPWSVGAQPEARNVRAAALHRQGELGVLELRRLDHHVLDGE